MSSTLFAIEATNLSKAFPKRASRSELFAVELLQNLRHALKPFKKEQGSITALKDVTFQVEPGEVVGLVGRNGSGKSTLLKILARISQPTSGSAVLRGRVAALLEVGVGFHRELTGRENIYLNGVLLGMRQKEIKSKLDEIVSFAGVESFIDEPVKHYSSGMHLRLAFSVAAHLDADIMLVDEALAVGDAAFQKKCLGKMKEVAGQGRTVIFVSHNSGAISSLCKKVIYLNSGSLMAFGEAKEVMQQYLRDVLSNEEESLESYREAGHGTHVEFTSVRLETDDDNRIVRIGQPLRFHVELVSHQDYRDLTIGFALFNSTGSCVAFAFGRERFDLQREARTKIEFTVDDLQLAPDAYYTAFSVGVGGADAGRTDLDLVRGTTPFEVVPEYADGTSLFTWDRSWGNIIANVRVNVVGTDHDESG